MTVQWPFSMATDRGGLEALAERFAYLKPHLEMRVNGILAFTSEQSGLEEGTVQWIVKRGR